MLNDFRCGVRLLRRSPVFATTAILTLALGIGAATAIFSVVDAALLRPLPYPGSDRLVTFQLRDIGGNRREDGAMPRDFLDWRDRQAVFEQIAAEDSVQLTLVGEAEPEELRTRTTTAGFFEVFHARPLLGRTFTIDDEQPGRPAVVVLGYGFWRTRLGGAMDAIGRTLSTEQGPHTIVGVMGPDFDYPAGSARQIDVFVARILSPVDRQHGVVQSLMLKCVGRLKDGVSTRTAAAQMNQLQREINDGHIGVNRGWSVVELEPLLDQLVGPSRGWMVLLLGAVGFVLLIACANVANLLLALGATRVRELAVRSSLGAGRGRIVRQLLAETLLLSAIGAAAGVLLAWWGVDVLRSAAPTSIPRTVTIALNLRALTFASAITAVTAILCGLLPAFHTSRRDLLPGLREGATAATGGPAARRLRNAFAFSEIALALILLVGAGLFIRSFTTLMQVDPGFEPSGLMSMEVGLAYSEANMKRGPAYLDAILTAVRAVPGVEGAAAIYGGRPFTRTSMVRVAIVGNERREIIIRAVTPDYLRVLRVPLVRGRDLDARDSSGAAGAAVLTEAAANQLWPGLDPIGRELTIEGRTFAVVGIAANLRHRGLEFALMPEAYVPIAQRGASGGTLVVRAMGDPYRVLTPIKHAIWSVNPNQQITQVATADEDLRRQTAPRRFNMLLMTVFAALALTIAVTGIYGVMAQMVGQRVREIGIRLALGATRTNIMMMIGRQGAAIIIAGLAAGSVGAWMLGRSVNSFLFEVRAHDPVVFLAVSGVLALAGLAACCPPIVRATRVDPIRALRAE